MPTRRLLALRAGVAGAATVAAPTFQRGLLPRSTTDQAMATGATAAYGLGVGTLAVSAVEASAELVAAVRGRGDPETTLMMTAGLLAAAGAITSVVLPKHHDAPLPVAAASSAARVLSAGSLIAGAVVASDRLLRPVTRGGGPVVGIATAAALGGVAAALRVRAMDARAAQFSGLGPPGPAGRPGPAGPAEPADPSQAAAADAHSTAPTATTAKGLARATAVGAAVGGGLLALAGTEFAIAEGSTELVSRALGRRDDPVTPLVGHVIAAATLVPIGGSALNRLRRRMMHADVVVEPAYPDPPTSRHVTAGPASLISFDDIGKEGRRFVLMALSADEISAVMGQPAVDPVRAVAGFGSAATPEARAGLALDELDALGAYERSVIVVAAPTGVGYVNYSFAEALEYLTRGDCAIVVPQYALVPSALALNRTDAGVRMQTLILAGIRDRLAALPPDRRPRLLQFGESLGAQVALDVAAEGTGMFDRLGLAAGLYLGTPFRTRLWDRWFSDPTGADPAGILGSVTRADEIPHLPATVRHVQVIHDDDPINKFSYDAVVREPWWMGPPEDRPPGVPRETQFRPVITFILNLIDLKNGMQSRPGDFVRVGHDYRIELCDAIRHTFDLPATDGQVARIEQALRDREREWAARRMVASRFASARTSVQGQLRRWGVDPNSLGLDDTAIGTLARGEVQGLLSKLGTSGSAG
jgi:uncharacterized membrane protein